MSVPLSRRQVLGAAAVGGVGLALGRGFLDQAGATAPRGLQDVEHVVILIQENRSFDHYFGTLRGVRGFADPGVLRQRDGRPVFEQPSGDGYQFPFHLDTVTHTAECTHDIAHGWGPQHRSWDGGGMDRFAAEHLASDGPASGPLTMGYYTRADLAFYYALADAFTVCDGYHCSVLGPTDPNRLYSMSATLDPTGSGGGPIVETLPSPTPSSYVGRFTWTTMPERLQAAGISWKVYQSLAGEGPLSFIQGNTANNVLGYFKAFTDVRSPLYRHAFLPTFPGGLLLDVVTGNLPAVSWVLNEQVLSADEHPPAPPAYGEHAVAQLLSILTSNPKVWAKTALFVTYDENGGFFDHVPPPTAPPGTAGEYLNVSPSAAEGIAGPIGLGFRVPMLVISPYTRGGYVCSDTFDHTSILRFIESRFGVEVPNLSAWRRQATGDLTSAFSFGAPPDVSVPRLPRTSVLDPTVLRECSPADFGAPLGAPPSTYPVPPHALPGQEPGAPRRPIP